MPITQPQIDFFHAQGYLPWGPILDDAELESLRREYDREFALAADTGEYRNLSVSDTPDKQVKENASHKMLQIMQMGDRNMHFRKLWYNAKFLDIVADLIGPNIQLFHDQALFKPAHHGGPVFWHQDNAYWKCRPASLISVWITLDDVKRENGAMQVIPQSHLKPVWHAQAEGTNALLDLEKSGAIDKEKIVVVDLPAGGCMFHHCQTLHYTQPNETPNQRRAFIMHYMPLGTRHEYRAGAIIPNSFSNPVLRLAVS